MMHFNARITSHSQQIMLKNKHTCELQLLMNEQVTLVQIMLKRFFPPTFKVQLFLSDFVFQSPNFQLIHQFLRNLLIRSS